MPSGLDSMLAKEHGGEMKAYVFEQYGDASKEALLDIPIPSPGPEQVLVKVRAAGVNPADWKRREGLFGRKGVMPVGMGLEASGTITAIGEGVTTFQVGDDAVGKPARGHGTWAEYTVMNAKSAALKPPSIPHEVAGTVPVAGIAAYDALTSVQLNEGARILIVGASGGVGSFGSSIAHALGHHVTGVASEAKRDMVEETGATFVAHGENLLDRLRESVMTPFDLVIDLVGGDILHGLAPLAATPAGLLSTVNSQIVNDLGGTPLHHDPEGLAKILDLLDQEQISIHVSEQFSLEEAGAAMARVEDGHTAGKIVVVPVHESQ